MGTGAQRLRSISEIFAGRNGSEVLRYGYKTSPKNLGVDFVVHWGSETKQMDIHQMNVTQATSKFLTSKFMAVLPLLPLEKESPAPVRPLWALGS